MIKVKDDDTKTSGTKAPSKTRSRARSRASGRKGSASSKPLDVRKVFMKELMDVVDAHEQLAQVLPRVQETLETPAAQQVLSSLASDVEKAQRSLGRVLEEHATTKRQVECKPVREMARATTRGLRSSQASMELTLLTITNLQKVLHYLIASLGSLRAWSEMIEDEDAVLLFRKLTDDAKMADQELTHVAEDELWSRRRQWDVNGRSRN